MESKLPKCAVLACTNEADPHLFARDVNDRLVMICDGHMSMPKPSEVAARSPDPATLDIAVLTCTNEADPHLFVRDVNDRLVMICDGHVSRPKPSEVAARSPDPAALDLAERIVRNSYSPTPGEVESIAHALIVDQGELADLRALAFALYADIELSPELLKVKQRLIDDRYAKLVAKAEAEFAAQWDSVKREDVPVVRCRYCGFEAFPFADATIEDHMKACRTEGRS
jgi:hypothetical protein